MMNGYEEWVLADTIKDYLGERDIQTILRLVRQGKIPGVKIAGQWKFKLSFVDKVLTNLAKSNR